MTATRVVNGDLAEITAIWNDNVPLVSAYLPMPTLTQNQLRNAYLNNPKLTVWVSRTLPDGVRAFMAIMKNVAHPTRDDITVDYVAGYFVKVSDVPHPIQPNDPTLKQRLKDTLIELGLAVVQDAQDRNVPFIYAWYPVNGHQQMINLLRKLEKFNGVRERNPDEPNKTRIEYILSPDKFLQGLSGLSGDNT